MKQDKDSAFSEFIADTCARLDEFEKLSVKDFRLVIRRPYHDGAPVIVKFWARPGLKGTMRRLARQSSARYEWRNLQLLDELGVRAPKSIGFTKVPTNPYGYTDAMAMEDLGDCDTAVRYVKNCTKLRDTSSLEIFESELIRMTATLVRARIIDFDHSLVNIVVKDGKPYRIDVEKARIVPFLTIRAGLYSKMIGQLLATYVFAVQPDIERARRFAGLLLQELRPTSRIIRKTQSHLNFRLMMQKKKTGIDTSINIQDL